MIQYNKKYLYSGEIVVPVFQDGAKVACIDKNNNTILLSASDLREVKKPVKESKPVQYIKKSKEEALDYSKNGGGVIQPEVAVATAIEEVSAVEVPIETPVSVVVEKPAEVVVKPAAKKPTTKKELAKDKTIGKVNIYDNYI